MDRTVITKRINRLACDIEKLKSTLAAIENTDIARYPENYNMLATDAALRSELIACRLRRLVFQSTDTKKPEYLASAGVVQGIDIREENGILKITLPCLLPKRKKRENTEFITDPLYFTLSRYSDGNPLKRYSHCVVCFSHIYSDDSKRYIRDYDNLELKQINEKYLGYLFKKSAGMSFCEYKNRLRLDEAAYMLEGSNLKIIDIAVSTGFANVSYFTKKFRTTFGVSPTEYRKKHLKSL